MNDNDQVQCPMCGDGHATLLGSLGKLVWLRCRDCGMDYNIQADGGQWDDPMQDDDYSDDYADQLIADLRSKFDRFYGIERSQ